MEWEWYQLYVKEFKNGKPLSADYAKVIDRHLNTQAGAAFVAPPPSGEPIRNENDEFEIRVFSKGTLGFAKFILESHYNLKIEREVAHD